MNEKQAKRGPGRPRKAARQQRIDITLSAEMLHFLDDKAEESRSQCIERIIRESPEFANWQNWDRLNQTRAQSTPNGS